MFVISCYPHTENKHLEVRVATFAYLVLKWTLSKQNGARDTMSKRAG